MPSALLTDWSPPGAATVTPEPKFEYGARSPFFVVAATAMTPEQFAGAELLTLTFELPAATTTMLPLVRAVLMAD
jgi:hypothetical protein